MRLLSKKGMCNVASAETGLEAVQFIKKDTEKKCKLILMDNLMPGECSRPFAPLIIPASLIF